MARTYSTMLDLGAQAPAFALQDCEGEIYSVRDQKIEKGLLVMFICNHCPYVIHILDRLVDEVRRCQRQGLERISP